MFFRFSQVILVPNVNLYSLTFTTYIKKSRYKSHAALYAGLCKAVRKINRWYTLHLSTFPYVAVHLTSVRPEHQFSERDALWQEVSKVLYEMQG